ncbi:MAG: uracil-DNA glycosylase [Bacteroidetes bacterium]|nr:uracil-DNA glycosylase [Bacteroidota bacterium]MBU1678606.1 uracil-DNA glycosylase [Bacteroidota bacterium]
MNFDINLENILDSNATSFIHETERPLKTDIKTSVHLNYSSVEELDANINTCKKCALGSTRLKFVFGVGNPNADLMLIGEAPGADEDKQGIPFVGRAGKLLNDILKAIEFERDDIYIANILKCRPPNNRDPLPAERETCSPYLYKQIELIKPKIILCLGRISANVLLNNKESLTRMRGEVYDFAASKLMVTYHPAALLRNPNWKRGCWEDVQKVRKLYDQLTDKK